MTVRQSAQMLREGEFTTRFLEVGHPDVDTMIRVYNRMVDNLREERVRLQEQQYFLGQLLAASPGGVIVLDHDGRVSAVNPAAARLLQAPAAAIEGRPLADLRSPLAEALDRHRAGRVVRRHAVERRARARASARRSWTAATRGGSISSRS